MVVPGCGRAHATAARREISRQGEMEIDMATFHQSEVVSQEYVIEYRFADSADEWQTLRNAGADFVAAVRALRTQREREESMGEFEYQLTKLATLRCPVDPLMMYGVATG